MNVNQTQIELYRNEGFDKRLLTICEEMDIYGRDYRVSIGLLPVSKWFPDLEVTETVYPTYKGCQYFRRYLLTNIGQSEGVIFYQPLLLDYRVARMPIIAIQGFPDVDFVTKVINQLLDHLDRTVANLENNPRVIHGKKLEQHREELKKLQDLKEKSALTPAS